MNAKQKQNRIARMQAVHDFLTQNPGATIYQMAEAFHLTVAPVRELLKIMEAEGYLTVQKMPMIGYISQASRYHLTDKDYPAMPIPQTSPPVLDSCPIRRVIVPARQVGMCRDALVAALFGAGPAVHA